jgi:hypothetical protein
MELPATLLLCYIGTLMVTMGLLYTSGSLCR